MQVYSILATGSYYWVQSTFIFSDRICHWTWSLLIGLGWIANEFQWSTCLWPLHHCLGYKHVLLYHCAHLLMWVQVFMLVLLALYQWSHLSSLRWLFFWVLMMYRTPEIIRKQNSQNLAMALFSFVIASMLLDSLLIIANEIGFSPDHKNEIHCLCLGWNSGVDKTPKLLRFFY